MASPMALEVDREEWFARGVEVVGEFAASGHVFSFDQVRSELPDPGHPNWFGALMKCREVQLLVVPVGWRPSQTRSRRGGVNQCYVARERMRG